MPCSYVIDKERRLVINTGWDRLTFAEMKAQQEELSSDPDFDPTFNQLVDVTGVTVLDLSIEEAKQIAKRGIYSPASRRAVLASSEAVFGMARLMDAYHSMATGRQQTGVFYESDAALKWLSLEASPGPTRAEDGANTQTPSHKNKDKVG